PRPRHTRRIRTRSRRSEELFHADFSPGRDRNGNRPAAIGAIQGPRADQLLEAPLLARQRVVVGADDELWIDRTDKGGGRSFGAAVVGGDEDIAFQFIRLLRQQRPLGGLLNVGRKQDRLARVGQAQNQSRIVRV